MRFLNVLKEPQNIDLQFVMAQETPISEICKNNGIAMFFAYGSLVRDRMKKLSDVDIAILKSSGKLSLDEYLHVLGEIQNIIKREDIDLVDLSEAPTLLKMRILQFGKLIYCADLKTIVRFRYRTITDYLATSFLRKSFSKYLRKAYGVA